MMWIWISIRTRTRNREQSSSWESGCSALVGQSAYLVGQSVHHVVNAEFVRVIGKIDRNQARVRPFPVLRDVVVEIGDEHQPLGGIVVLEHAPELRRLAVVARHEAVRIGNLEEGMKER